MKHPNKPNNKKNFQVALVLWMLVGALLVTTTVSVLGLLKSTANSSLFGWLSLSGAGVNTSVGLITLVLIMVGADIFWLIAFVLWLLRKKLHIESSNKTLRLP